VRWLGRWWPALAWAVVISVFSTGTFTAENTGRIIIPLLHWFLPSLPPKTLALMHHVIRKCGHFTEYFILSLLILRGIRAGRHGTRLAWAAVAILLVAGYAALDEFHQSFVPGRTAAISDVLLDTTGGITAQVVAALAALWFHVRGWREEEADETC
jgi:VanZ family protein